MKSKVYFIREISPENIVKLYDALGVSLQGNVAVKLHSGEDGNQNFLKPEMLKDIIEHVHGTVVECNTAYDGARDTTEKHVKLMEKHGWSKYFDVDIMDAEGPDTELDIPGGKVIKKDYVGKHLDNYDSMLVLSHFKGHPMGGLGGALKQLSIGIASSFGKRYIHCLGDGNASYEKMFQVDQVKFIESMADAASAVAKKFEGNIAYINVMANLSVDCDCCAVAEDPCMKDIGILASLDPVAIDNACLDLIKNSSDPGKEHFLERVSSRHGEHIIDAAYDLKAGNKEYELVEIK